MQETMSDAVTSSSTTGKRKRKVEDDLDLTCPIRLELPLDPVIAEDGRVYEREAIVEYFKRKLDHETVKSPYTNEILTSQKLFDATQHHNTIEVLIENGVITGDLADKWTVRANKKKALLKKAEQGDLEAMVSVATNFFWGKNDFAENNKKAYQWCRKAHAAGSVVATAFLGVLLANGLGVEENENQGTMYLGIAAAQGSNYACYHLGRALAEGGIGLEADVEQATRLLESSVSENCKYDHMLAQHKVAARTLLCELKQS